MMKDSTNHTDSDDRNQNAAASGGFRRTVGVGVSALCIAVGSIVVVPGVAMASPLPDPIGGLCDGDPNMQYTPTQGQAAQMGEGFCRTVITETGEAIGRAGSAVGDAAVGCAEQTLVGGLAGAVTSGGGFWRKARKAAMSVTKVVPGAFAIECAYDIAR